MRSQFPRCVGAMLVAILAGGTQMAPAQENVMRLTLAGKLAQITAQGPGRLAALSARQQLRDQVCIAMADGKLSRYERSVLLANAKQMLKPEEYASFRESLNRVSPPAPPAKYAVRSGTKRLPVVARADAPPSPQGVTEIIVSDNVAPLSRMR
jgi:hypothetical protein